MDPAARSAEETPKPLAPNVAALLWALLLVALSPVIADWVRHLVAEPTARYAVVFVPLLVHLAWTRPHTQPRRAMALVVVLAAVLVAFLAVGGGVTRIGRLAVPFAILGLAAWIGRPGPAVVGLAFFAIPVPSVISDNLAELFEAFSRVPEILIAPESVASLLAIAALFAGFGYYTRVARGAGVLDGAQGAAIASLWSLPVSGALVSTSACLAFAGAGEMAAEVVATAPLALALPLLAARLLRPETDPRWPLTSEAGRQLVLGMERGDHVREKLKERADSMTLRLWIDPETPVIVKLWSRGGFAGRIRRLTGTDPARREARALTSLLDAGIAAPAPLGVSVLGSEADHFTDALFLEDLGSCDTAFEHLKRLIREGEEERVVDFLDEVVEITGTIVERGIVDTDHSLNNLVVTEDERLFRLDTELARRSRHATKPYGVMLGRLLGSFVFAVQPDLGRVPGFAGRLKRRLDPSPRVLREASAQVQRMLASQRERKSLETRVTLPWD